MTENNQNTSPEMEKISAIIEQNIRPGLQAHGGDLDVVGFENNVLSINYKGACGGCPHAAMGTMQAIEGILKEQYDPNITVKMVN